MKFDVFISYSRKDYKDYSGNEVPGNYVSRIKEALGRAGLTYWIDEEGIYSGDEFPEVILSNIEDSGCMVFVSTEASNESKWTSKEIHLALQEGKRIIPLICDDTRFNKSVRLLLADIDYIDLRVNPTKGIDRLVSAVKENRERLEKESEVRSILSEIRSLDSRRKALKAEIDNLRERYAAVSEESSACLGKMNSLFDTLQDRHFDASKVKDEVNLEEAAPLAQQHGIPSVELDELKKQKAALEAIIEKQRREIEAMKSKIRSTQVKGNGFFIKKVWAIVVGSAVLLLVVALGLAYDNTKWNVIDLQNINEAQNTELTALREYTPIVITEMEPCFKGENGKILDVAKSSKLCRIGMTFNYLCFNSGKYVLKTRLYEPDGGMDEYDESPAGYTLKEELDCWAGENSEATLGNYGYEVPGYWSPGKYRWEIWLDGKCIGSKEFTIEP